MNTEEIDYWLRLFSNNNNQSFMSKDGKKITLFKVFQELKELHYLLKIKNDYINELEAYKYNLDRDYLRLEKENKELKEHIEKYEHYCKTTGIEELMKENKKYKEEIDKAIKLIEKIKERRILRLLEMEVLEILKEVE